MDQNRCSPLNSLKKNDMKNLIVLFLLLTASLIQLPITRLKIVNAQSKRPPAAWLEMREKAWRNHTKLGAKLPWRQHPMKPAAAQTPALTQEGDQDNRMVFQSYRDGNYEIYSAYGDGSSPVRLTNDAAPNVAPKLHPGGVLVAHRKVFDTYSEIAQVLKDGSRYAQLTTDGNPHIDLQWSPDGQKIAYAKRVGTTAGTLYDIFVADYTFDTPRVEQRGLSDVRQRSK